MKIGPYSIEVIIDGYFGLDGGAMFGIVPSPLWARSHSPDGRNRIELAARCLLMRSADRCVVVETGLGDKFDDKRADIFNVRRHQGGLLAQLADRGIGPDDVTDVILTHLHFDHCGGTTFVGKDGLELSFPRATHHVQRRHWEWAQAPTEKDGGSFRGEDFELLADSDRLVLVDGPGDIMDGVRVDPADGHTPGMQLVSVEGAEGRLLFCADLVPTRSHLRWPYIMAYDNQPLVTLAEKKDWLQRAAAGGWIVVFGHDPEVDAAILDVDEGVATIGRQVAF